MIYEKPNESWNEEQWGECLLFRSDIVHDSPTWRGGEVRRAKNIKFWKY